MKILLICILIVSLDNKAISQPRSGQIDFGLVSVEIPDTTKMKMSEIESTIKILSKPYEYTVYYNNKYVLVIKEDLGITWKDLYDRKKQISYITWENANEETIPEDTSQGLISPLSEYISRIDSAKKVVGRIDNPSKRRNIHGFDCFEVLYPNQNGGKSDDSRVYITDKMIVPSILFGGPFTEKYLVMEYWQSGVNCTLVYGAKKLIPGKVNKKLFKWNLRGFKHI